MQTEPVGKRVFGKYLRGLRKGRRLTLANVEDLTIGYPEPVTRSHLSRVETGQAFPSFPRIYALSCVYGVPVATMARQYETTLNEGSRLTGSKGESRAKLLERANELRLAGRSREATALYDSLLDAGRKRTLHGTDRITARLHRIECLIHSGRYTLAKDEAELALGIPELTGEQRFRVLLAFITSCFRLRKVQLALIGIDSARQQCSGAVPSGRLCANLDATEANLYASLGDYGRALDCYENALSRYGSLGLGLEVCRTRINMSSALIELGEVSRARELLTMVLREVGDEGYDRQAAFALSNLALIAFKGGDLSAAETLCVRSNAIPDSRQVQKVRFRNCYYLWRVAQVRGDKHAEHANEEVLRIYLGRIEEPIPEREDYRTYLTGGRHDARSAAM